MTTDKSVLFCMPYAGGDRRIYTDWQQELQPWINVKVIAANLPGRGRQFQKPAFTDVSAATEYLFDQLEGHRPERVCLFGHSMGALLAFSLARTMEERRPSVLSHLIVSAGSARPLKYDRLLHTLPFDALVEALGELQGTPPEVLANREMMAFLAPTIRADIELCERYTYRPAPPLSAGITAISGTLDRVHRPEDMFAWRTETAGTFEAITLPGDHFYIHNARSELLSQVGRVLQSALPKK